MHSLVGPREAHAGPSVLLPCVVTDGNVAALAPDGSGGYYIGGRFSKVGGVVRHNLAHVRANGTVDLAFDPGARKIPDPWREERVDALVLSPDRGILYVGGRFNVIGGKARKDLAALDVATGHATAWTANADGRIKALAMSPDGATIYVGGFYYRLGGAWRDGLAALETSTGHATGWDPDTGGIVDALAVSEDGSTVYVGGHLRVIGGKERSGAAALDSATGGATDWDPNATGGRWGWTGVSALAVRGSTVYLAGDFHAVGGETRHYIAAVDTSGRPTDWDPDADSEVEALAVSPDGSTVYAGGHFVVIGGGSRRRLAALNASTGDALAWSPSASNDVLAFGPVPDEKMLFAGGAFGVVDGRRRRGLVRLATPRRVFAYSGDGRVDLSWSNLGDANLAQVRVLRSPVGHATSPTPTAGQTNVYEGAGFAARDASGVANGTRYYYSAFAQNGSATWSGPATVAVTPRATATLGWPWFRPLPLRRDRPFYLYGTLIPVHGERTWVALHFYRWNAGRFRRYGSRSVYVLATSPRYRLRLRLPHRGVWLVVARHQDGNHSAGWSSPRRFRVR